MKMISNMKTKEKIILFISIFFLVTIMGIGISFAYYTAVVLNGESKSSIISQSGNLEITYVDGEKQILGVSVFPGWHDSKTFTVKNTGDNATTYSIKVTNITNTFTIANSISLSLESSDGGKNMGKRTLPRNEATIVKYVSIDAGDTHTYTVTTYYNNLDIDQSADKGKRFSYTIEVGASVGTNDTLIAQNDTYSSTAKVFNGPITKEQVESIKFKDTNKVPSNAVASWDVSKAQNGSIMAYTLNEDSDDLYELYIGQEGGVTLSEDASYIFGYYSSLSSMDLTYLDTSNVASMHGMFYNSSATTLDLSSFDTSNVTNMSWMFYKSVATEIKGLNNFSTSKATDMSKMFSDSKATSLDLSSFDTSNVTNMSWMFYKSVATKIKGLNNFSTSKVTDMSRMFSESKLTTLDLSSFDTSNVTNMSWMFYKSVATEIKGLNNFSTSKVTDMSYMFGLSKLTTLDLSIFDTSNVTNMDSMFFNSAATEIKGLNNFSTSKVTDMSKIFGYSKLTTLDLSSFDTSNVTNMYQMFYNSAATEIKGLNNFSTSKVTDMSRMFSESKLTTLDLSSFDTSNVTNMSWVFSNSKATNIVLSGWDTSKVTNMSRMFSSLSTTNVTGLDKLNTSSVTNMSYMFYKYPGEFIELLSFNTSKVTDMSYMFGRSKLDYIDLSSFDTTNVTNMTNMFQQVSLITGYARTSADAAKFNDRTVTGTATTNLFTVKN